MKFLQGDDDCHCISLVSCCCWWN